jgi:2-polyprenyl-3-methyl-5-hydroxy-6-metoxy-1,4-benzoquinol methylase
MTEYVDGPTDREISEILWRLYSKATLAQRALAAGRTYICPFDRLTRQVPHGAFVFDIGCGTGAFLNLLSHQGRISAAVGCDVNARALNAASQAAASLPSGPVFHRVESSDMWPSGPFDAVSLIDLMHHVPPNLQSAFFTAAASRVRPGGILIYKDMAKRPFWRAWTNRLHDLLLARQWINYVLLSDVIKWAAAAGFSIENREEFVRGPYGHELIVFRRQI